MRSTQTCPKCAGQKFAVTDEFRQPLADISNVTTALYAITIALGSFKPGQHSESGYELHGTFETWICIGCGYTEFYAHRLKGIEQVAQRHPERLRIVDARPPEQGPDR